MKLKLFSIIPIFLIIPFLWDDDQPDNAIIPTGIMLDSLDNEVMLRMEDGHPKEYFSNVFTPVCNTGECLPVKVNFYWDLTGKYLRFDQPEGEILTKLDHEPFTDADYILLDDILRGPDPRLSTVGIHHDGAKHNKQDKQDSQAAPAPESMMKMSKYEMVDGITGSTLPEVKDQFVPGALYTTYTLWGLANDHRNNIKSYTTSKLLSQENLDWILTSNNSEYNNMVINHLTSTREGEDARRNVLCEFLDSGNPSRQKVALNHFYWNDYKAENVQEKMHNLFYNSDDIEVRKLILQRWAFNHITPGSMTQLSVNVHTNQDVIDGIIALYLNKLDWSEIIFENLVNEMDQLEPENQQKMLNMFKSHKIYLSDDQWEKVKRLQKKYK